MGCSVSSEAKRLSRYPDPDDIPWIQNSNMFKKPYNQNPYDYETDLYCKPFSHSKRVRDSEDYVTSEYKESEESNDYLTTEDKLDACDDEMGMEIENWAANVGIDLCILSSENENKGEKNSKFKYHQKVMLEHFHAQEEVLHKRVEEKNKNSTPRNPKHVKATDIPLKRNGVESGDYSFGYQVPKRTLQVRNTFNSIQLTRKLKNKVQETFSAQFSLKSEKKSESTLEKSSPGLPSQRNSFKENESKKKTPTNSNDYRRPPSPRTHCKSFSSYEIPQTSTGINSQSTDNPKLDIQNRRSVYQNQSFGPTKTEPLLRLSLDVEVPVKSVSLDSNNYRSSTKPSVLPKSTSFNFTKEKSEAIPTPVSISQTETNSQIFRRKVGAGSAIFPLNSSRLWEKQFSNLNSSSVTKKKFGSDPEKLLEVFEKLQKSPNKAFLSKSPSPSKSFTVPEPWGSILSSHGLPQSRMSGSDAWESGLHLRMENVLRRPHMDIRKDYAIHKRILGHGRFGVIRVCVDRTTGERLACKTISKDRLKTWRDAEDILKEVAVMELLHGHPNIVRIKGCYEDEEEVHIVMEMCRGGELFDRIKMRKRYSERKASIVIRTLVQVLQQCHVLGIVHRDVKPENILLVRRDDDTIIKLIDFGVATLYEGVPLKEVSGTPYYLAPEVLRRSYGPQVDIWSAGIVLYILLSGIFPSWAAVDSDAESMEDSALDMRTHPWPSISNLAKDLVRGMLTVDPRRRMTPEQILKHPWIQQSQKKG